MGDSMDNLTTQHPLLRLTTNGTATAEETFRAIAPINTLLAFAIIMQNSLVVFHYFPDRQKLITRIFILIACADLVQAVGTMINGGVEFYCYLDTHNTLPSPFLELHFYIGLLGWAWSDYYNVLLTVLKSLTLANPFESFSKRGVTAAVWIGSLFWLAVAIADVVVVETTRSRLGPGCSGFWSSTTEDLDYFELGQFALDEILDFLDLTAFFVIRNIPFIVANVIPCVITLICIPIQIFHVKRSLRASSASNFSRESDHVSVTILLVSLLYVLCNSPLALLIFVELASDFDCVWKPESPGCSVYVELRILAASTLPLLNAAGFPLIMILRKRSLRERYKDYILAPVRALRRVRSRWQGYQEVE